MKLQIAVRAKVLITHCNVSVLHGLANGPRATGTIINIATDPREPTTDLTGGETGLVRLLFPPLRLFVIVRVDHPGPLTIAALPGLQIGEFPLVPITRSFTVHANERSVSVERRQLPLTLAYAFTDFKSQGQTLEATIVDLGKPASFTLSPFNAYVALSRSRSRDTIRLLRDFGDSLFIKHPSHELYDEEKRLKEQAMDTKRDFVDGKYDA